MNIQQKILKALVAGALALASLDGLAGEADDLKDRIEEANAKGYGVTVSTKIKTLVVLNKTNNGLRVRKEPVSDPLTDKDWSDDIFVMPNKSISFPINSTHRISLNGDGNSDDIKINDSKGYIEYNSDEVKGKNVWGNLVTWNGEMNNWVLTSLFDSIDGSDTTLVPSVMGENGNQVLTLTLLPGYSYGRSLFNDFRTFRLYNDTKHTFHLAYFSIKKYNPKREDTEFKRYYLEPENSIDFNIYDLPYTTWISLNDMCTIACNGGDQWDADDIEIHNQEGFIEFNPAMKSGSFLGITLKRKDVWITQAWWNPTPNRWYGLGSQTSIDGHKNTKLLPSFDTQNKVVIFTLR